MIEHEQYEQMLHQLRLHSAQPFLLLPGQIAIAAQNHVKATLRSVCLTTSNANLPAKDKTARSVSWHPSCLRLSTSDIGGFHEHGSIL
jgi:hypothetical protein